MSHKPLPIFGREPEVLDPATEPYQLLTLRETADLLSMSMSSLYKRMREEGFPRPVKLGQTHTVRFRQQEVFAWIDSLSRCQYGEDKALQEKQARRGNRSQATKVTSIRKKTKR